MLSRFKQIKKITDLILKKVILFSEHIFKEDIISYSTVQKKYITYPTDIGLIC
jgi:hypothetical protein